MERVPSRWSDPLRVFIGLLVALTGVGALSVSLGPGRFTTYAGTSTLAAGVTFAAGTSLVIAGLATALSGRSVRSGDLAVLASITWFAPVLVGWQEGPPLVRSVSAALAIFLGPLILHLVLAHPSRRPHRDRERAMLIIVYGEAAVVALTLAAFRDPFFDPSCFANCSVNAFLVHSSPGLVHDVEVSHLWFGAGAGLLLAGVGATRAVSGSRATRRRLLPVALPAVLLGSVVVIQAAVLAGSGVEDPSDGLLLALYLVECSAVLVLAWGLVTALVRAERERRAVARIVVELDEAPAPGDVEAALRQALGDPDLRVAYRLTDSQQYVDAGGRPVPEPTNSPRGTITSLTRDRRTMAVISHPGTGPLLEDRLGSSVQLGLENERLQAQVLAQVEEVRRSRARIVEAGDIERRRLERDLHDGAQQRLLALSYDIRLACANAQADGDACTATVLHQAIEVTQGAVDDLRDLARGIFPASLAELGLAPTLESLADCAPVPVRVRFTDRRRVPDPVETAAYFAVAEAVEDAVRRSAAQVEVLGSYESGCLVISVRDDGTAREASMVMVRDRIGALGGHVHIDHGVCRMEMPCG